MRALHLAHRHFPRAASALFALATTAGLLAAWPAPPAQAATTTSITVDGSAPGRVFDGVGAISGGGGNSRLLVDYPEPQRGQILDYLFKPSYGASLQTLKIEIGGDTNTTDGAEASHEHTQGTVDCHQGYEWWLAEQAKARNPAIKLYGLAWGAPGWVGGGSSTFFTDKAIGYLSTWMDCASQHGLQIDYLGGWNERGWNADWYRNLKSALAAGGHGSTRIVAADDTWGVADAMTGDAAFKDAVDFVGVHYPCGYSNGGAIGNNAEFRTCSSTTTAQALGKPLWASENGSEDAEAGAEAVARAVNRDYIDGRMTAYYNWPLVAGAYPNTYFAFNGLAVTNQPWSGHYRIAKTSWVLAHTSQFAQIGWKYQDSASGYLGGDRANGSYVTLRSPNRRDYSTVIETTGATAAQTITVQVANGLSSGQVHVWDTNLRSPHDHEHLAHIADLTPAKGAYALTLQPGHVYTLTTTTGQGKGTALPPAASALGLPRSDTFENPATTPSPAYFTDMNGAFQAAACGGGRQGSCLRQMAPSVPVRWTSENYFAPYTVTGDDSWGNYTVTADTMFEQPGAVELLGRVGMQGRNDNGLQAYHLRVGHDGTWAILRSDVNDTDHTWAFTTLADGTTTAPGTGHWHTAALTMQGPAITATLDGKLLGSATDTTYTHGRAGLGTADSTTSTTGGGYQTQQFDNLSITPGTDPVPTRTGAVPSGLAGKCLDLDGGTTQDGTPVQLYDCNQWPPSQTWTYGTDSTVTIAGKCLDVAGQAVTNGSPVHLWTCNGGDNQKWTQQADGTLRGTQSGLCLDVPGATTANRTHLALWTCNSGNNQRWYLP
ncbi:ricin-type beta-trefoil lectin domain protein [Kitasatospora sp. NPDC051853]|uniref:ricin-type beta-trefoil lectin domain protein n=1 Tax=Kitasatospora sp. NPDC051853 TaxID=3364058 RepID=UPI00378B1662